MFYGARRCPRRPTLFSQTLKKRSIFCHRRGIENFCRLLSTQQRPNVFVSDAWPGPAAYHRPFGEHCRDHRSCFMAHSLFLSIDVCRGLGISPLQIKIWWSFLRTTLAQHLSRKYSFRFFFMNFSLELLFGRFLCSQRAVQKYYGGYR